MTPDTESILPHYYSRIAGNCMYYVSLTSLKNITNLNFRYTSPYLIGVASGGIECGHPGAPILMAEVAEFYHWIVSKVWPRK